MPHDNTYPNETAAYRAARNRLLEEEAALRAKIEEVAELRRALPLGGEAEDYEFAAPEGAVRLSELFREGRDSLVLYSFMYGPNDEAECPMCSAYLDSANGQVGHITQRTNFAVVATSPIERIQALAERRGWDAVPFLSAAGNTYAQDYFSEMPNGGQVPMCNVFVRRAGKVHHFWGTELFFERSPWHPRHVDMLWPLWHYFDLLPEGRGDFMPRNSY